MPLSRQATQRVNRDEKLVDKRRVIRENNNVCRKTTETDQRFVVSGDLMISQGLCESSVPLFCLLLQKKERRRSMKQEERNAFTCTSIKTRSLLLSKRMRKSKIIKSRMRGDKIRGKEWIQVRDTSDSEEYESKEEVMKEKVTRHPDGNHWESIWMNSVSQS